MKFRTCLMIMWLAATAVTTARSATLHRDTLNEASFTFGACYAPLLQRDFFGGSLEFKYYPVRRWGTGITFMATEKNIRDTFTFHIKKPQLDFYEFGWINQFDLVHTPAFRLSACINNGLTLARLGDDADRVRYWTRYGSRYQAREVATNYYYLLQPGADIAVRIFGFAHYPDCYLTGRVTYRFLFGNSRYAKREDFEGYSFSLGFAVIGFVQEEQKKQR